MPEIKHHFTGGKMNKDLDERLIPNGEYRDAMNIQVSTSEESEVGTIQNILGNSLVPGQSFIGDGAFCVGSIADEKNDKLYYFVTENKELIQNGNFDIGTVKTMSGGIVTSASTAENWILNYDSSTGKGWEWSGQRIKGTSVPLYNKINQTLQPGDFIENVFYKIKVDVSGYTGGDIELVIVNENGKRLLFSHNFISSNGSHEINLQLGSWPATTNTNFFNRFYIQRIGNSGFTGTIDNISVKRVGNYIIEYDSKTNSITPVLIDTTGDVLNFSSDKLITGINIIDDMLFWTDNHFEPKKINIPRSIKGTDSSGLIHSDFVNEKTNLQVPIEEKHITVLKEKPALAPKILLTSPRLSDRNYSGIVKIISDPGVNNTLNLPIPNPALAVFPGTPSSPDFTGIQSNDEFIMIIESDLSGQTSFELDWSVGDTIYFNPFEGSDYDDPPSAPFVDFEIKAEVVAHANNNFDSSQGAVQVKFKMITTSDFLSVPEGYDEIKFGVDKFFDYEKIFEFKFPRIAYRYKYQDNEYSVISPFSQVAFLPGAFNYHPKSGFNTGMTNRIEAITISNFMDNIPDGVIEVDIIYKEEGSTNLYIVDTIKPEHLPLLRDDNYWYDNEYIIKSEQVSRAIESNQLLRPWDNVPKKALAQEVSGSRIIYGNYTQGYDLKTKDTDKDYYPNFSTQHIAEPVNVTTQSTPSIKSMREYQIGAVFVDKYGRETPVVSNSSGIQKILKKHAPSQNKIQVSFIDTDQPKDLEYFKFFIKETSGEYYNMAMDRWYDAEDDHLWLSFPSSDINKVAIDDFIILKKALEGNDIVEDESRYKVIDIQTEAPEHIKTQNFLAEEIKHNFTNGNDVEDLFGNTIDIGSPTVGKNKFEARYKPFSSGSASRLHEVGTSLRIEFIDTNTSEASDRYQVASLSTDFGTSAGSGSTTPGAGIDASKYTFKLTNLLGDDVNFITDDPSGNNPTKIRDDIAIRAYKYIPKNLAEFDGRFFVKINKNASIEGSITNSYTTNIYANYRTVLSKKIYSMRSDHRDTHGQEFTGMRHGAYADVGTISNLSNLNATGPNKTSLQGFGAYASYFRNYNKKPGDFKLRLTYSGTSQNNYSNASLLEVGQYAFSETFATNNSSDADWVDELAHITTNNFKRGNYQPGVGFPEVFSDNNFMACGGNGTVAQSDADTKRADDQNVGTPDSTWGDNYGVWYIRQGSYQARKDTSINSDLSFNGFDDYGLAQGQTEGIQEHQSDSYSQPHSRWNINIGGIFHDTTMGTASNQSQTIDNFFDIGSADGNPNYNSNNNVKLANAFTGSGRFMRWKEDHSNNIYRIVGLRKNRGYAHFAAQNNINFANVTGSLSNNNDHTELTAQLSPNFSSEFQVRAIDQDTSGNVNWNPCGDLGPIQGGLVLSVTASAAGVADTQAPFGCKVFVSSLQATHTDLTTHTITVGMILTSHSNGTSGNVYHGNSNDKEELLVYKITGPNPQGNYEIHLTGYRRPLLNDYGAGNLTTGGVEHDFYVDQPNNAETMVFEQPKMNGYSQYSCNRINAQNAMNMSGTGVYDVDGGIINGIPRIMPVSYTLEILDEINYEIEMPDNPAIWETEPKETTELDIYYEASGYNPVVMTEENMGIVVPPKSIYFNLGDPNDPPGNTCSIDFDSGGFYLTLRAYVADTFNGSNVKIVRPDGSSIFLEVDYFVTDNLVGSPTFGLSEKVYVKDDLYNATYNLSWYNCFSFGNGVESNRIRDNFNLPFISNGVKASTTIPFPSDGEEHRKYGLIYSGLYNAISSVNNLNQFVAAEKITKDINPIYGSIQKLHSRDSDLVTLCEDKVLKILANKDAVFNADGNPQLTANQNVLGQTMPFVGEYGISDNPESFASESYRAYFTDRVRGAVMRLSKDGLTPISEHGMKSWFRDNLSLGITNLLGENNLSSQDNWDIPSIGNSAVINGEAILGYYNDQPTDPRFGKTARLKMDNVMEVGKTYRIRYTVVSTYDGSNNSGAGYGYLNSNGNLAKITLVNTFSGSGWISAAYSNHSIINGAIVDETFVSNRTDLEFLQYQINSSQNAPVSGYTATSTQTGIQLWAADQGDTDWSGGYFYGSTVKIKDIILEEVKEDLTLIGSYDDKKDEYNISIHGANPTTVSFKESTKGWASFKSFIPESALSCANDYYTVKEGKLWQHHNPGVNRNTFYNEFTNSTFNTVLNDIPSSIKSYHTLEYEGSKSKIKGLGKALVTGIEHYFGSSVDGRYAFFEVSDMTKTLGFNYPPVYLNESLGNIKQYRNNVLIYEGSVKLFNGLATHSQSSPSGGPTKGFLRKEPFSESNPGDFLVGDVITTEAQENVVTHLNYFPKQGWFVSSVETDKEKGSLPEFLEKEGKWFNYIKGVDQEITPEIDYGSFDIQGLGVPFNVNNSFDTFEIDNVNSSLQVGDDVYVKLYVNDQSIYLSEDLNLAGKVTSIQGQTITIDGSITNSQGIYLFFVKNQAINMNGLSGYFANVKFENDSAEKAELMVVSSEITESSK